MFSAASAPFSLGQKCFLRCEPALQGFPYRAGDVIFGKPCPSHVSNSARNGGNRQPFAFHNIRGTQTVRVHADSLAPSGRSPWNRHVNFSRQNVREIVQSKGAFVRNGRLRAALQPSHKEIFEA